MQYTPNRLYFKGLQHNPWTVCSKFWPALPQLLTDGKEQQFRMCFQPQSCTVPWLPGACLLSHSFFLWGTSIRKVAPGKVGESRLQPRFPSCSSLGFLTFPTQLTKTNTMPGGGGHSWPVTPGSGGHHCPVMLLVTLQPWWATYTSPLQTPWTVLSWPWH